LKLKKENTMNKLILISIVSVLANLVGIANAQAESVIAEVNGVSPTIATVQLTDTKMLKVIGIDNKQTVTLLSATVDDLMVNEAEQLASAQIIVGHRSVICMMMPLYNTAQDLYVDGKSIISGEGCYFSDFSHPATPAMQKLADSLRTRMVTLAEQQ
jgi:hypothetical protein